MPFVQRNTAGVVVGIYPNSQPGYAEEWLPDDDPAVAAFRSPPAPVPEELSRWQFFAAAAGAGIISQQEAEDAITGPLPAPFVAFIATLPEGQRFTATMLLRGNQVFHRHHSFVQAFLNANGMTDAQADAIWRAGAALGTV